MEDTRCFLQKKTHLRCGAQELSLTTPVVMGILNVTPDSFFSGSRTTTADAIAARACQMLSDGAAIIDVGAYSTRPGASAVPPAEELRRLCLALEVVRGKFPRALISVDTFRAEVVREVVAQFGAVIVNDISGGQLDAKMFETAAELSLPYVLMHMRGTPQTMQQHTRYDNLMEEVSRYLSEKVSMLHAAGVADVILDPGFGFAKTTAQNFELLARLEEFKIFELPLLVGLSRKSMVCRTLNVAPADALNGTTALNMLALAKGADILRVHDVKEAAEAVKLAEEIRNYELGIKN
ncbi:MAG: dihydropteroate synthase [Prevotellaceae bacterium]|jgi:dihydropteroate synthase|nr:dihydropteroate synthase [Prevotellaceae bacterium]